jgi:hypothetical protein
MPVRLVFIPGKIWGLMGMQDASSRMMISWPKNAACIHIMVR